MAELKKRSVCRKPNPIWNCLTEQKSAHKRTEVVCKHCNSKIKTNKYVKHASQHLQTCAQYLETVKKSEDEYQWKCDESNIAVKLDVNYPSKKLATWETITDQCNPDMLDEITCKHCYKNVYTLRKLDRASEHLFKCAPFLKRTLIPFISEGKSESNDSQSMNCTGKSEFNYSKSLYCTGKSGYDNSRSMENVNSTPKKRNHSSIWNLIVSNNQQSINNIIRCKHCNQTVNCWGHVERATKHLLNCELFLKCASNADLPELNIESDSVWSKISDDPNASRKRVIICKHCQTDVPTNHRSTIALLHLNKCPAIKVLSLNETSIYKDEVINNKRKRTDNDEGNDDIAENPKKKLNTHKVELMDAIQKLESLLVPQNSNSISKTFRNFLSHLIKKTIAVAKLKTRYAFIRGEDVEFVLKLGNYERNVKNRSRPLRRFLARKIDYSNNRKTLKLIKAKHSNTDI